MSEQPLAAIEAQHAPAVFPLRIALSEAELVGKGSIRLVYEHPAFPGMLVKVFRPDRITAGGDLVSYREKGRLKLRRRLGAHRLTAREFAEYVAFRTRFAAAWNERPVAAMLGVVETDQGLGLVVERLADERGALAPTLASLVKRGQFCETHRSALAAFFRTLEERHVCVGDLHAGNIVWAALAGEAPRFIAVDGTGLRSAIPIQDWFKRINAVQVRKRARRVWAAVDRALAQPRQAAFRPELDARLAAR